MSLFSPLYYHRHNDRARGYIFPQETSQFLVGPSSTAHTYESAEKNTSRHTDKSHALPRHRLVCLAPFHAFNRISRGNPGLFRHAVHFPNRSKSLLPQRPSIFAELGLTFP